jgi:hypothetical protein
MRISFDKEGKFNIGDIEEFYLDFFSAALYLKHYAIINKLFGLPQLSPPPSGSGGIIKSLKVTSQCFQ